jgi:hypothetical protein
MLAVKRIDQIGDARRLGWNGTLAAPDQGAAIFPVASAAAAGREDICSPNPLSSKADPCMTR